MFIVKTLEDVVFWASVWGIIHETGGPSLLVLNVSDWTCCEMTRSSGRLRPIAFDQHCHWDLFTIFIKVKQRKRYEMILRNQNSVIRTANKRCSLCLNQSDKGWSWALFLKSQGLRFPIIATWQSLGVPIHTAPRCLIWGFHNHCNFGLCCQQPQRAPQAMMETLLAVAVHQSDGRVGTMSLPQPDTHSLFSPCSVPIFLLTQACCTSSEHFCWHSWVCFSDPAFSSL